MPIYRKALAVSHMVPGMCLIILKLILHYPMRWPIFRSPSPRRRAAARNSITTQRLRNWCRFWRKKRVAAAAALVFGREDSGLTNDELALADILTGVPMVADYPSLNLGQAVMVYCYQLASLIQNAPKVVTQRDDNQLRALRLRARALLEKLDVADDMKMADWLDQRVGMLEQRDTAMLHRLLHDIEKTRRVNHCHKNVLWIKSLQWCGLYGLYL
jgi:TrmH family RNA methyltransferase